MRKASLVLMVVTILAKVFGLLREKTLATFFGASATADVFLVAFALPMVLTNLLTGAIGTGFIPLYDDLKRSRGKDRADLFMANLVNVLGVMFLIVAVVAVIGARPLVHMMAPGLSGADFEQCVQMSRFALASIAVTALASVFRAYLQIHGHFIVSVAHPMVMNVFLMGTMALGRYAHRDLMGPGIFLAFVLQYVIFLPALRKTSYHHRVLCDTRDVHLRRMVQMILPVLVSTAVIELNYLINKALASTVFDGGISAMNYASRLMDFVTSIVITSIVTVTFPRMSAAFAEGDLPGFRREMRESIALMSLLVIPAAVGLAVFAEPIVSLLFRGGAFGERDVLITGKVLFAYAIGVVGLGFREILSRAYYAQGRLRLPMVNSVLMVLINVTLSVMLRRPLGLEGLALATSISLYVGAFIFAADLWRKGLRLGTHTSKNLGKILVASLLMGGLGLVLQGYLPIGGNLGLLASIALCALAYGVVLIALRVEEVKILFELMQKRRRA